MINKIKTVYEKTNDIFRGVYKGKEIEIIREPSGSFYIVIIDTKSGVYNYDDLMPNSDCETIIEDALEYALYVGEFI